MRELRTAILMLVVLTVVTGVIYPLLVTGIAQTVFPAQAAGSLIVNDGKLVGSALIGQPFDDPKYFWSRLSATSPSPYNGGSSSGSNLGPLSDALRDAIQARVTALREAQPNDSRPIPVDLVTASGSGLDPHVSPAAAYYQVPRVARVRSLDEARVQTLVAQHIERRQLGFLGEPRVNVLRLNLALDALSAR
ncbi:MAG: potassium-transporting ATPase subunit KdpC [Deltaproteobacteria bacterium]|nr:potassium-transporting ATPase subunit KdpC [Deltaproteobacteria bacterium]MBI3391294.1 potassium-transporting ATPase subunit KdpC [Deltaproteobacteria bacterium]